MTKEKKHILIGVLLILITAIFLTFTGYFVTVIEDKVPMTLMVAYRFLFGFIMLVPLTLAKKDFSFKVKKMPLIFARSFTGFIGMSLFFYALKYLPLSNSVLLINTSPLFIPVVVYFLTGVKTNKYVITSIVISFVGFVIIIHPESSSYNIWGYVIGIFSGFFSALAATLLKLAGKQNKPEQVIFYYFLFSTIIGLIISIPVFRILNFHEFIMILLVAFTGLMYQFGYTYALKFIQVRIAAPLMLSSVLFSSIMDWFFKSIPLELPFLIGAIIMILGIIGTIKFNK